MINQDHLFLFSGDRKEQVMKDGKSKLRMKCGEAAEYLGISPRYIRNLSAEGIIPYYRISSRCHIYDKADLDQFLTECRVSL